MTDKIYSCTAYDPTGRAVWTFYATRKWCNLRRRIAELRGLVPGRITYSPRMTRTIAEMRARNQIVSPSLRDD